MCSIGSDVGHCLAAGIIADEHTAAVAQRLMAPDMFSGWGIRTLSSEHPAYNPLSYQLGGVWPMESGTIAYALRLCGFPDLAAELARATFDLAGLFPQRRLPEVVGGYPRDDKHPHPGIYPEAESPQAWSAAAIPQLIQAMLGIRPFAPLRLLFVDPALPDWLPELTLSNVRVGDAHVALRFHRERDGGTNWTILDKRGTLHVVQQPMATAAAGIWERGADLLRSCIPGLHWRRAPAGI